MNHTLKNNVLSKAVVSIGALTVFILHSLEWIHFDAISLAIITIAILPWIAPAIRELQFPGLLTLRLREVEAEIDTLKFFVSAFLPRWEFEILDRLSHAAPYEVDTNKIPDTFRRDLGDLWGRGFVRQKTPNRYLPSGIGKVDLKEFYEIDELGRQYIELRQRYKISQDSEATSDAKPRN